jgi:succinylarginine dihydrolase
LSAIFSNGAHFVIHDPVPGAQGLGDEGAANHTRLAPSHGAPGLHLFVYGHHALANPGIVRVPRRFSSRQAAEASAAVARNHLLDANAVRLVPQHPDAIDAGVFHNDVISVGNENVFLYHERAFANGRAVIAALRRSYAALNGGAELVTVAVTARRVPLADAVRSYLFNSQLVTLGRGETHMALIAPEDCREIASVRDFLDDLLERGCTPIHELHFLNVRQSMRNGGGPACLRLRVVLTPREWAAVHRGVRFDASLHDRLAVWIRKYYREGLSSRDLSDPDLLEESRRALDKLTQILRLGSIYPFQQA